MPPSAGSLLRTLKDGFWDRTELIAMPDGTQRVRKRSKGAASGPWAVRSLRREIAYLRNLPHGARAAFPAVLAAWDDGTDAGGDIGYDMPFFASHRDAGELARGCILDQAEIDAFQHALAAAVIDGLHVPESPNESLARHVVEVVHEALAGLEGDPWLARVIQADELTVNGIRMAGTRAAFARLVDDARDLARLDTGATVRLHGDFFLENLLWRPHASAATNDAPQLVLLDPVSVAGVSCGPAVFDLVKYVSYASGELPALRSEAVSVEADAGGSALHYAIRHEADGLRGFHARDWCSTFRRAFEARHGAIDRRLYHLIDGYFSAAMALNTGGLQRRARLVKATLEFNAVLRA